MWDPARKLTELLDAGVSAAQVTVVHVSGSAPCAVGSKMLVTSDGRFFGTIGGGHLEELALADAKRALSSVSKYEPAVTRYPLGAKAGQCCGGVVDLFIEVFGSPPTLYLFGVGHVGQALTRVLDGSPFVVHAIDEREEWIASEKIPPSVKRNAAPWFDFAQDAAWNADKTYVAVMTYRHDTDQAIIEHVIEKPARYIGLIGSRTKWNRFKERLTLRGVSEEKLARVKSPIGLHIGGKSPHEVAISIAAELLATLHEAPLGLLHASFSPPSLTK